jgi:hypothetical protein
LDALLENIFVKAMNGISPDKQQEVFKRFHEKTNEQQERFTASLAAFQKAPSIEGLLDLCDSDKRWQNFNRVKKHHELLNGKKLEGDYSREILWPRNCLAHGVPERVADGTLLFKFNGKEFPFNDQVSQELRTKIITYKKAFTEIVSLLDS